jgi:16S rRNA (guanine527-N7)-methyltransferase
MAAPLSDETIHTELARYGVEANRAICEMTRKYTNLLLRWNQRISLTSLRDPLEILRFHFGESMLAASAVPIEQGRLADVGSGAGFPGLALKIVEPRLDVELIESNKKKATFLGEVCRELGLAGTHVFRGRAEDLDDSQGFDFVTARAVGSYADLLGWAGRVLNSDGKVVLWLGSEDAAGVRLVSGWTWREPIRVSGAERRVIAVGAREKS